MRTRLTSPALRSCAFCARRASCSPPWKRAEPGECTHAVAGAAPDEVASSWSVNLRLCMPGPERTHNERLIVADPLSESERRQRDRVAVFCVGKSLAPLVERDVKRWAGPLRKEEEVNFELRLAEPGLHGAAVRCAQMRQRRRDEGAPMQGWPCAV